MKALKREKNLWIRNEQAHITKAKEEERRVPKRIRVLTKHLVVLNSEKMLRSLLAWMQMMPSTKLKKKKKRGLKTLPIERELPRQVICNNLVLRHPCQILIPSISMIVK